MLIPKFKELKISDIKGADYNPTRRVEGNGIRKLADSLSRIGLIYHVIVDENNVLVDGHRRVAAAKLLGWATIGARIVPSENRDQIYGDVNVTAKKMAGNDALGVWLKNKNAVSKHQSSKFAAMSEDIGAQLTKRIWEEGLSSRVWDTARSLCRYCGIEDTSKVVGWLLDHAVIGQVMKALEAKEDPRIFTKAISNNRPIRFKLQVD